MTYVTLNHLSISVFLRRTLYSSNFIIFSQYIQQATVVGRDLGGFIAWDLSLHYPERIL